MTKCIGCGVLLQDRPEPLHTYLSVSSGCWGRFNDAMVLHYSDPTFWNSHQLLIDTYVLQHSCEPDDKRARKSATLHAAALASQVEYGFTHDRVVTLRKSISKMQDFEWIEPPSKYRMTIVDVVLDQGAERHFQTAKDYAEAVWEDWSPNHALVRQIVQDYATGYGG